jgi:hypothetical protein
MSLQRRSAQRLKVERRYGLRLDMLLKDMYYRQRMCQRQIADDLEVPLGTVGSWMWRLEINPFTSRGGRRRIRSKFRT